MAKTTFFKELKTCKEVICVENSEYKNELGEVCYYSISTKRTIYDLINMIEDCFFSKSKNTKFICEHWELNATEMTNIWNRLNNQSKSESTFRVQIHTICSQLYDFFGTDIFTKFYSETDIQEIKERIMFYSHEDLMFDDFAIQEINGYVDKYDKSEQFDLSDCENEIEVLKTLRRCSVFAYLDTTDGKKLAYLKHILNKPIIDNNKKRVNQDKLELLKKLDDCVTDTYKHYSSLGIYSDYDESEEEDSEIVENESEIIKNKSNADDKEIETALEYYRKSQEIKEKYGIADCIEILDIIQDSINMLDSERDLSKQKTKDNVVQFFRLLQSKQVKDFFSKVLSEDIEDGLNIVIKSTRNT